LGKDRKTAKVIDPPKRPSPIAVTCLKSFTINTLQMQVSKGILLKIIAIQAGCQFFSLISTIKMVNILALARKEPMDSAKETGT
jgi:hypothetical protein